MEIRSRGGEPAIPMGFSEAQCRAVDAYVEERIERMATEVAAELDALAARVDGMFGRAVEREFEELREDVARVAQLEAHLGWSERQLDGSLAREAELRDENVQLRLAARRLGQEVLHLNGWERGEE